MPSIAETATINGQSESLDQRAKKVWQLMVDKCINRGIPIRKLESHDGYLYNGSVNQAITELWPDLDSQTAHSLLSAIRNHLKKNKNVYIAVEKKQLFVAEHYTEPKKRGLHNGVAATSVGHTTLGDTTGANAVVRNYETAKRVWTRARAYCINRGMPSEVVEGQVYWRCDKRLAYFIKAEAPSSADYARDRQPVYDLLRGTANAVTITSKRDERLTEDESYLLVRDQWSEMPGEVRFRSVRVDSIDRRAERLTPEEAGETREPAPVIVTKQAKATMEAAVSKPVPAPPQNANPAPEPDTAATPDKHHEPQNCPDCGKEFKNYFALSAHSKVHRAPSALKILTDVVQQAEKDAAEVQTLRKNNEGLKDELARTKAELEIAQKQGDVSVLMELLGDVLNKCSNGVISPMRAIADVDDLIRTTKGQQ